jgi:D-alanine-D-alanine ligase
MIRVGVIRGGVSPEYDVSLATGANVLSHLRGERLKEKYKPVDILIDKSGVWHKNGLPITLQQAFEHVDVIWNALHGDYGEDGKVQQVLEHWKVPYTGSGVFPSALAYHKGLAKEQFKNFGIKTPEHILLPVYQADIDGPFREYANRKAEEIVRRMPPPWIVKPFSGGSSVGIHVCKDNLSLLYALKDVARTGASVMVEELVTGKEATVAVIEGFRGEKLYALPSIEIRLPKEKTHFDYNAKYKGESQEICPGKFLRAEKVILENLAKEIHKSLGLRHYSRSDFIVNPKKGIYALEVNTLPGLTDASLLPLGLSSVGATMPDFIDHVLSLALSKT